MTLCPITELKAGEGWTTEVRVADQYMTKEEKVEVEKPEVVTTTYRVTAYCSCSLCCGKWANNRPLDSNGLPIVIGASGEVLENGVSGASPLPFGTRIELENYGTVVVQDRTADWIVDKHGNNIIDIYFNDHEKAKKWGVKYLKGAIKGA